jgi:phosphoenolpyruvate-protein kinase (PTS system EI component)
MIVSAKQFLELRSQFAAATAGMATEGLQHGVLFEVPAACLAAAEIMQVADFGCIGTNDLIQYLFGVDRGGTDTRNHSDFETSSVLWELIAALSHAAAGAGKPMAICGELAGKPELTCRIMSCGITAISTSAAHVAGVRRAAETRCSEPPSTPA